MTSSDLKSSGERADEGVKTTARAARDNVTEMASRAKQQAQGVVDQAAQKASDVYGRAKEHAHAVVDHLPSDVSDAYVAGQRVYSESRKTLGRGVAKQPLEAFLLACAIGYLVGWATSRS